MTMTKETLQYMHRAYLQVTETPKMSNILDILNGLKTILSDYNPPEEDVEEFDMFLRNIESSIRIREKTFKMTNMVSDIVFSMLYIAIWANETKGLDIDINIIARRKSLESELTKLLEKDEIHDRFGIRGIVLNSESEDICIEKLTTFSKYIHNILTKCNRKDYTDFTNWIKNNPKIDNYTKERLAFLLRVPLRVYNVKDYITYPKNNGYQSLHFVLMSEMYSDFLPGAEFEVQLRTLSMHQHAVNGDANHDLYKAEIDDELKKVFHIENFSAVNIIGFTSYNSVDDDIDGIHHSKQLVNRRISNTLIIE